MGIKSWTAAVLLATCTGSNFAVAAEPTKVKTAPAGGVPGPAEAARADASIDPQLIIDDLIYKQLFKDAGATLGPVVDPTFGAFCVTLANGVQACLLTSEPRCPFIGGTIPGGGVTWAV